MTDTYIPSIRDCDTGEIVRSGGCFLTNIYSISESLYNRDAVHLLRKWVILIYVKHVS